MVDFTVKTAEEIRNDILRTIEAGLNALGIDNPNVGPGSDNYVLAQAVGNQIEVAMANAQVQADGLLPDTAAGENLDRWLAIYGLSRRQASGATGSVLFSTTASTYVSAGTTLLDDLGQRYEVTVGGYYADGDTVPVAAVDVGVDTNHESGDVLRWVSPPPFANLSVTVASSDISGGVDEETDDVAAKRLREFVANPPLSGNPSHVALWAENASTLVEKAFVYPAASGPGNYHVTVVGYATDVSKGRSVNGLDVSNVITPYVEGQMPRPLDVVVSTVNDVEFDVAFFLTLPSSPKASPPGPGGGWTDGTTWPRNSNGASSFACRVTSAEATGLIFTVDAPSPPTKGVSQIAFLSPIDWTTYTATVVDYTGSVGAYVITVDKPFVGIAVGNFISPNAVQIEAYFDATVAQFAKMGPGEVLDPTSPMIARGYRHPPPAQGWPYKVDATMLRALVSAGEEVLDADFAFRTSPWAPSVSFSSPNIYIPRNIGFYELLS